MKILKFFLIVEFIQILEIFRKLDLPSKIEFNSKKDSTNLIIEIYIDKKNDIIYSINFYKNNKILNTNYITNSSFIFLLDQYKLYIQNYLPFKENLEISSYKKIIRYIKTNFKFIFRTLKETTIFKFIFRTLKETTMNNQILLFYLTGSVNIYTVNGFNKSGISRTIIRSFTKVNIISNEIYYSQNLKSLIQLHNLNIKLFDFIIQNKLRLIFLSLIFIISVVRVIVSLFWMISNIVIISIGEGNLALYLTLSNVSVSIIILNISFLLFWLFAPSLTISYLKFKIKRINKEG